jgi:hypothetical protein
MSTAENTTAAPAPHYWLRTALVVVALIELLDALSSVHNLFTDYHHETALLRFAQALTSVKLALAPLVAGSAVVLAVMGRTRQAIGALAILQLLEWIFEDVWSIPFHGLELSLDFGGIEAFLHHFGNRDLGRGAGAPKSTVGDRRSAGKPADADQLDHRYRVHHQHHDLRLLNFSVRVPAGPQPHDVFGAR